MAKETSEAPLVGVVMGSKSDWETMRHCSEVLTELGIPHESKVVSAHRTPDRLFRYGREAEGRGLEVVIAGAGGAAHLPGMLAAITMLPVLGVPVESKTLRGVDSLLVDRADASRRAGRNARHRGLRRGQRGDPGRGDSGAEVSRDPPGPGPVSPGADRRRGRAAGMSISSGRFRVDRETACCILLHRWASSAAVNSAACSSRLRSGWAIARAFWPPQTTTPPRRWPTGK